MAKAPRKKKGKQITTLSCLEWVLDHRPSLWWTNKPRPISCAFIVKLPYFVVLESLRGRAFLRGGRLMGYYTHYKLEVDADGAVTPEPCPTCGADRMVSLDQKIAAEMIEGELLIGDLISGSDEMKWYQHEEDMKVLSAKYPDVLFTLHGEGEEACDVWVKYFKGGLMQVSKVAVELNEFDPSKLK